MEIHNFYVWLPQQRYRPHAYAIFTYKLEELHQRGDCQGIVWISVCIVLSDS